MNIFQYLTGIPIHSRIHRRWKKVNIKETQPFPSLKFFLYRCQKHRNWSHHGTVVRNISKMFLKYFCFSFIVSRALLQSHSEFSRLLKRNFLTCYSSSYYNSIVASSFTSFFSPVAIMRKLVQVTIQLHSVRNLWLLADIFRYSLSSRKLVVLFVNILFVNTKTIAIKSLQWHHYNEAIARKTLQSDVNFSYFQLFLIVISW